VTPVKNVPRAARNLSELIVRSAILEVSLTSFIAVLLTAAIKAQAKAFKTYGM
jgi:hypothetical protein